MQNSQNVKSDSKVGKLFLVIDGYEDEELGADTLEDAQKEAIESMHDWFDVRHEGRTIEYTIEECVDVYQDGDLNLHVRSRGEFIVDETYYEEVGN